MIAITTQFMTDMMAAIQATAMALATPKVGVFTANVVPTYNSTLASLGVPIWTDYADVAMTFLSVFQNGDGSVSLQGKLTQVLAPSDGSGVMVYGYYVTDGADTPKLLWAETFADPVDLTSAPAGVTFSAQFVVFPSNNNGAAIVVQN